MSTPNDKLSALAQEYGDLPPELLAALDLGEDYDMDPPTNEGEFPDPREHQ